MPFRRNDPATQDAASKGGRKAGATQRAAQRVRGNPARQSEENEAKRIVKRNQQDKTP